jgi:hypothetical protein
MIDTFKGQSWHISRFKDEFGLEETMRVVGCSKQSVYNYLNRDIRIVLTADGDELEAWENKKLHSVEVLGEG